jgi:hypothetical protein
MATTAPLQESLPNIHTDAGSAIAEFEQILLSNSGEDAFESAIKLLAAKLIDEIRCDAGSPPKFTQHSTPQGTHAAITNLYRQAVERWPELGDGNDLEISRVISFDQFALYSVGSFATQTLRG